LPRQTAPTFFGRPPRSGRGAQCEDSGQGSSQPSD
jgi:hypothetical protein